MMKKKWWLLTPLLIISVGCLTVTSSSIVGLRPDDPEPTGIPPTLAIDPVTEEAWATLNELAQVDVPPRDRYDLAARLLGITSEGATPAPESGYKVGDVETFFAENSATHEVFEVEAECVYAGPHVYMWVEQGLNYDPDAMTASAEQFEQQSYPTNRAYFGSEPLPGIDGDPRLHVLHTTVLSSGVAGYFYSPSEYPADIVPYSNEKEIFYINFSILRPGDGYYDRVLSHEFQHMIHWSVDQNEESWMNEGLSELAAYLNDFGPSSFMADYLYDPDIQLTGWPEGSSGRGANYGGAFLFDAYFLDRFGQDALKLLVKDPANGMAGVDSTLDQIDAGLTADEVFGDWLIANMINDPTVGAGNYAYAGMTAIPPPGLADDVYDYPYALTSSVHQYGVDYIQLNGPAEVDITFTGTQQVSLIPADTQNTDGDPDTDDSYVWWSNRGDDSDMTLARRVDLTEVDEATLEYDLWYWIEELWDYGYLTVSTDGGQTWQVLPTAYTTEEDPHGNAYGPGYTGQSFNLPEASEDGWLHESIDLSAFAGQEIYIGFEMVTDDAVNQPGMAIDNICIPAIDWCDDAESDDEEWEAQGFVRHNNILPQQFVVQLILPDANGNITVLPMPLDEANQGELSVTISGKYPATLVISGLTRYTTEVATYQIEIK